MMSEKPGFTTKCAFYLIIAVLIGITVWLIVGSIGQISQINHGIQDSCQIIRNERKVLVTENRQLPSRLRVWISSVPSECAQ